MKYIKPITALMLILLVLAGCTAPAQSGAQVIAQPVYPEMAPYPDQSKFVDSKTGAFDDVGFSQAYERWSDEHRARIQPPDGYADSLSYYFQSAIPAFLSSTEGNAVCSPLNVYLALALLAESTDGDSRQEILSLLEADSMDALREQAGRVWNAHYCNDGASTCTLANSLWLDADHTYQAETVRRLAEDYYASVFQGDLGSEEVNQLLRSWLNEQTGGLLAEQAENLSLDPQTVLALASTIYYRAKWSSEFWPENNTKDTFHAPSGDHTVTYMNTTMTYGPYYWGDDFGAVSLGLEDGSRMWLFLPDVGLTPEDLLSSGHAMAHALGGWLETENQKSMQVNLSLPKFDTASDLQLENALQQLGITSVFDPGDADFSPILPEQTAWLDSVDHAARVKIDEEGVEAAAYTVMIAPGAAKPPEDEMDFILDRPFLFFITSRDDLPLFAGMVNEP